MAAACGATLSACSLPVSHSPAVAIVGKPPLKINLELTGYIFDTGTAALHVTAADGAGQTSQLGPLWDDGYDRMNLYRSESGDYVLVSVNACRLVTPGPLRISAGEPCYQGLRHRADGKRSGPDYCYGDWSKRRTPRSMGGLQESAYFDRLYYVGVFDFQGDQVNGRWVSAGWGFRAAASSPDHLRDTGLCRES